MNRQFNSVEGATVTLTSTNASYLVAFLALFLGVVAGHFWAILSFAVFQLRSTLASRDGQHHQQQVVLRNYHAPGAAIWQLIIICWSWRKQRGIKAFLPALPIILLALMSIMSFAVAGILSARVTNKESDVLIKGSTCGWWMAPVMTNDTAAYESYVSNLVEDKYLASTMAAACNKDSGVSSDCVSYSPKEIEWTTKVDVPCPFDQKICYQNKSVRFDSGLADTTQHFGINARKEDRLQFRMVTECSPLVREGYVSDWHSMNGTRLDPGLIDGDIMQTAPDEKWIEFYYGASRYLGLNSTLIYSDREPTVHMFGSQLWSLSATESNIDSKNMDSFVPIPELNRTDADVNILFLRQEMGMQYTNPVNDPWFEANTPKIKTTTSSTGIPRNATYYVPDFPISVVGCAMQYQWCDPGTGQCTDLTGRLRAMRQTRVRFKRPKQQITILRMAEITTITSGITSLATSLAGSVLLINKNGIYRSAGPRDDQWIQELSHMFGTLLKVMQIRNFRYTGGYTSDFKVEPVITPPLANETWMCDAQMVRRDDFQSLSVLGIALICSIGGLIIITNLCLDSVVAWYHKRWDTRRHVTEEWEMLQAENLQRQLYKTHGADWREENVSLANVLETVKNGRYGRASFAGRHEAYRELKSMSSAGSLGKDSEVAVGVRRMSTERTLPVSPLARYTS